jgi:hypothetical protein
MHMAVVCSFALNFWLCSHTVCAQRERFQQQRRLEEEKQRLDEEFYRQQRMVVNQPRVGYRESRLHMKEMQKLSDKLVMEQEKERKEMNLIVLARQVWYIYIYNDYYYYYYYYYYYLLVFWPPPVSICGHTRCVSNMDIYPIKTYVTLPAQPTNFRPRIERNSMRLKRNQTLSDCSNTQPLLLQQQSLKATI